MKHRLRLTATHLMNCGDLPPLCLIDQSHGAVSIQLLPQPLRPYDISLLDPVIVLWIFELERYNAEVHKILPADTGIGLCQYSSLAQKPRRYGSVLTAGALSVIFTRYHDMSVKLRLNLDGPLVELLVDNREGELADLLDIATEWQHLGACPQDFVCRDVVPHLEQHRPLEIFQLSELRQAADIGPLNQFCLFAMAI